MAKSPELRKYPSINQPLTTSPNSLPSYIDFPNDPIIPLPGKAINTLMYFFPIHADYTHLVNVCNQRLNFPNSDNFSTTDRHTYTPLLDQVFVMLSHMEKAHTRMDTSTTDCAYKIAGWLRETAVQIVIPVLKVSHNSLGEEINCEIELFIPYIFIDNPISLVIGREHVGFPKMLGKFNFPAAPFQADNFDVSVYGFQNFDSSNPQFPDYFPWLNIQKKENNDSVPSGIWSDAQQAWSDLRNRLDSKLHDLDESGISMVFLKQFRDIADPQKACYKAINEAACRIDKFHWGWFLSGSYDVMFQEMASYPIMSELGLSNTTTASWPFWIAADLAFDTGKTVWKSPS